MKAVGIQGCIRIYQWEEEILFMAGRMLAGRYTEIRYY